jgi:signal recognition particle GTPase
MILYMTNHGYRLNQSILKLISQMSFIIRAELDSPDAKVMNVSRIIRVARGSGRTLKDVHDLLNMYKQNCKAIKPTSKMLQKSVDLTQISKLLSTSSLVNLEVEMVCSQWPTNSRAPRK